MLIYGRNQYNIRKQIPCNIKFFKNTLGKDTYFLFKFLLRYVYIVKIVKMLNMLKYVHIVTSFTGIHDPGHE